MKPANEGFFRALTLKIAKGAKTLKLLMVEPTKLLSQVYIFLCAWILVFGCRREGGVGAGTAKTSYPCLFFRDTTLAFDHLQTNLLI